jgi:hypothetical protein
MNKKTAVNRLGVLAIWAGIIALLILTLVFLSVSLDGSCFGDSESIICYWRIR